MNLKELPDLSNAEKLELLILSACNSLEELPPSILKLHKLEQLEVDFCKKLKVVPTLFNLESLHHVFMAGCWQMRNIPDISRNITYLTIAETMLEDAPDSIWLCGVETLRIGGNLSEAGHIEKLPDWIKDLHQLQELSITNCPKLASLPELPASLDILRVENCESLETFPIWDLHFPTFLYFPNCFKLDREARTVVTNKSMKAWLPGGTIPAKFNQQASGNSLTIRSDFSLFEICVVVSPNGALNKWSLLCDIRVNGCANEKNLSYEMFTFDKEHLYISFVIVSDEDEGWREQDNEILF